jgi:hypothetical protein
VPGDPAARALHLRGATVFECPFWQNVDRVLREQAGLRLCEIDLDSGDGPTFAAHNRAFFRAVARVSGKRIIVDSSKKVDRLEAFAGGEDLPRPCHPSRASSLRGGPFQCRARP